MMTRSAHSVPRPLRRTVATAATLAAVLTAVSCAGDSAETSASDGAASSRSAFEGDYAGEELTVLMNTSHEGAGHWLAEHFEERTGVQVEPVFVPYDEIAAQLTLDQQSGANTIDVAAPWYVSLGDLAHDGSIRPITDYVETTPEIGVDDFVSSLWEPYSTVDGEIYGLPFDGDTHVLFYNEEILARNGYDDPPDTWDEYAEQVATITENERGDGVYGAALFGEQTPMILGASFANRLAGFDGRFLDDEGRPKLDSDEAVRAAEALHEVWDDALPTPAETDFGAGNSAWFAGKVAFIENWTDLGIRSQSPESGSEVVDGWGVTTLPTADADDPPRASLVSGFSWVVSGNTTQDALSREFIRWAASSEINSQLLTAMPPTGVDPTRRSSLEDETYGSTYPDIQQVNETTLDGALAWPTGRHATQAAQVLTDELAAYLSGQRSSADETMQNVQQEWERLLVD